MNPILTAIFPQDIYQSFVPWPESITGWEGDHPIFSQLVKKFRPHVIIEVGTWKGMSALTMAKACQEEKLDAAIICVDTWLGSEEHLKHNGSDLNRFHGYPTIYYQFLSNVIRHNAQGIVVPLPTTSLVAADVLEFCHIKADLIYIDANHQTPCVLADLLAYYPLLRPGGVMFGHDLNWPTVKSAVDQFAKQRNISYRADGMFWIFDP